VVQLAPPHVASETFSAAPVSPVPAALAAFGVLAVAGVLTVYYVREVR
jgi:hypothetical protein